MAEPSLSIFSRPAPINGSRNKNQSDVSAGKGDFQVLKGRRCRPYGGPFEYRLDTS
jgi:hypothetical protein